MLADKSRAPDSSILLESVVLRKRFWRGNAIRSETRFVPVFFLTSKPVIDYRFVF
jgi:hypothetical protein